MVPEIPRQLFVLEQFLRVVVILAEPLVLDTVHQRLPLAPVDGLRRKLDERLRVALEVVEPVAVAENPLDAAPGEARPVLQLGQHVRQGNVAFVQHHRRRAAPLGSLYAGLADGDVSLAPLQPRPGNLRRILKRPGALRDQSFIVELNPVGGLVLDAVPQFLEFGALENRLTRAHPLPLIGVLDVEASRQRAQHFGDFGALRGESLRWREAVVLERLAQGVLDASLRVDVVRPVQVLPEFLRRGKAEGGGNPIVAGNRNSRKLMHLHDAEANSGFFLYLPLQLLGELLVALSRHDRQRVDVEAAHAFALAVDAQAQASPDRLAPVPLGADVCAARRSGRRWDCPSLHARPNARR